jgi:hypothetical protein
MGVHPEIVVPPIPRLNVEDQEGEIRAILVVPEKIDFRFR